MIAPREIELKLELDPSHAPKARRSRPVRRLPGLQAGGDTRRLVSAIFDTDDHALRRRGYVLRIRRDGERRIQTLKGEDGGGAIDRAEWESDVAGDIPDLAAIPDEPLREALAALGPLGPVLETDFERTLWHLRRQDAELELVLDEGTIRAGDRTAPISEIEIELKSGSAAALFEVAREILAAMPARLGLRSKSERGYGLLREGGGLGAEPFRVDRTMRVDAAFQTIVRACLRQFHLHEPGIHRRDAENLHKARVAIRRLRSGLKLHKAFVACAEGERLKRGLRSLSAALGEARNLDVLLARLEDEKTQETGALRARVGEERAAVYDRLAARLRSKRVRLLLLDLMAFAETGAWLEDPALRKLRETRIRGFARKVLEKRWRRLRKSGRDLAGQDAEARHRVRIEGKVLRYASEFYAGAFPGKKRVRRRDGLLDALGDIQGALGELNDIETGAGVIDGAALPGPPANPAREAALLAKAEAAHRRIRKAEPFWA